MQSWSHDADVHENMHDDLHEPLLGTDSVIGAATDVNECVQSVYSVFRNKRRLRKHNSTNNDGTLFYDYDKEDAENHKFSDCEVDMDDCEEAETLDEKLSAWVTSERVKDNAVDKLLKILKPHHPDLPVTSRTLMGTGRRPADVVKVAGGEYIHFGILNGLKRFVADILASGVSVVSYQVNVDGLPLFRSSSMQLWPIFGRIISVKSPFLIGAFCGATKPSNVNEFLRYFIEEAIMLKNSGFTLEGISLQAQPVCYVCDAPARALLKQTKSHTGYYGCDRCIEKGEYVHGRVTFPQLTSDKRTDELFANVEYEDHQLGRSPLIDIGCGMVSGFILDYMHLVCLGVVRRLLHFWMRGALDIRLSARSISLISQKLVSMRGNIPSEFSRKPRGLTELEYWKASELRQFLLYTGIVVLKDQKMNKQLYEHFVCLSVIMHILLSPSLSSYYSEYVEELGVFWVRRSAELYGQHFVVYNVHCLIHLIDDCRNFGSLDHISAFPYENYMRVLKSCIRKPQHILQQLSNRMSEGFLDTNSAGVNLGVKREHTSGPMVVGVLHCKQYRQLQLTDFVIKMNSPDNCIMYGSSKIGLVANIVSDGNVVSVVVQKFGSVKAFFSKPLKSSDIGIFKVSKLSRHMEICLTTDIQRKYVILPYHNDRKWIAIPLNHSL